MSVDYNDIVDFMVKQQVEQFTDGQPLNNYTGRHQVVGPAEQEFPDAGQAIQDAWTVFKRDYIYERPAKNGDLLNEDALTRADELGVDVKVDESVQEDIIEVLQTAYQESPSQPSLSRDEFISQLDHAEDSIDQNTHVLKLRHIVEFRSAIGVGDDGYLSIRLSDAAQRRFS